MSDKEISFYSVTEINENLEQYESNQIEYVHGILHGNNVSLLTGGSKTGKSTLALDMGNCISKGIPFLGRKTLKKSVLYISIDNDDDLIADRVRLMNLGNNENFIFSFKKNIVLGNGIEPVEDEIDLFDVIQNALYEHPDLGIVIIDLLDNIRTINEKNEYSNAKVATDITHLRELAKHFDVHIVGIHHDTKSGTGNGYNAAKGGVELTGTLNGAYLHLIRNGIGAKNATFEIGGRNVPESVMNLTLDTKKLTYYVSDAPEEDFPYEIGIIRNYICLQKEFEGTLSTLLAECKLTIPANQASRLLNKFESVLQKEGIFIFRKNSRKKGRIYTLRLIEESTGDDGDDE